MPELIATQDTWIKRDTLQATSLSDNLKHFVKAGTKLKVTWTKTEGGHTLCSLAEPINGFYNWYLWSQHFNREYKPPTAMSEAGMELITHFEGYANKITSSDKKELIGGASAYWDSLGGIWTIGYGSTSIYDEGLARVRPVLKEDKLTHKEALSNKARDVARYIDAVRETLGDKLLQREVDALASLAYNAGEGSIKRSIRQAIEGGHQQAAADAILKYNKSGDPLRPVYGLSRRRAAERAMFLGQDWKAFMGPNAAQLVINAYGSAAAAGL